jgi:hypothetical protein
MKIINTHYIPLAEPHNIIMAPGEDAIAEQIGVLSVIEEAPTEDGGYGIKTHEHPVTRQLPQTIIEKDDKHNYTVMATVAKAEGDIWWHVENTDCLMVCPVAKRVIHSFQLNLLMMSLMAHTGDDYDPMGMMERFKECGIKVVWPDNVKENHQEIILTNMNIGDKMYLQSYIAQPLFLVYFADVVDDTHIQPIDDDDIFFEFVNQARTMLEINPKYDFHFTTIDKQLDYIAERLNEELNNYLERPDESE